MPRLEGTPTLAHRDGHFVNQVIILTPDMVFEYDGIAPHPSEAQVPKVEMSMQTRFGPPARDDKYPGSITDEARSAIIEAALHDILGLADASGYEEAAKELNDRRARQLLAAPADDCIEPEHHKERTLSELAALGLIRSPTRANLFGQLCASIIGTAFGAIILLELIVPYGAALLPRYIPAYVGPDLIIDAAVISALFATAGMLSRAQRYWLTEFGKSIQTAAKPFFKPDKSPNKRRLFAWVFNRPLSVAIGLSIFLVCILPVALQSLPKQLRYRSSLFFATHSNHPARRRIS
jgi:hypothetical protein